MSANKIKKLFLGGEMMKKLFNLFFFFYSWTESLWEVLGEERHEFGKYNIGLIIRENPPSTDHILGANGILKRSPISVKKKTYTGKRKCFYSSFWIGIPSP